MGPVYFSFLFFSFFSFICSHNLLANTGDVFEGVLYGAVVAL